MRLVWKMTEMNAHWAVHSHIAICGQYSADIGPMVLDIVTDPFVSCTEPLSSCIHVLCVVSKILASSRCCFLNLLTLSMTSIVMVFSSASVHHVKCFNKLYT